MSVESVLQGASTSDLQTLQTLAQSQQDILSGQITIQQARVIRCILQSKRVVAQKQQITSRIDEQIQNVQTMMINSDNSAEGTARKKWGIEQLTQMRKQKEFHDNQVTFPVMAVRQQTKQLLQLYRQSEQSQALSASIAQALEGTT